MIKNVTNLSLEENSQISKAALGKYKDGDFSFVNSRKNFQTKKLTSK